MEYLDFEVEVKAADGGSSAYDVSILRSPAGEARARMNFPFGELELENHLQALQIALLSGAARRRRVLSPETQKVRSFGRALFDALISGDVRTCYAISQREANHQGKGLRLKLRIQPPELAALPWEFLYDPTEADYVSLSRGTPVIRYLELPQTVEPMAVTPPLRILGMVAAPQDLTQLDVEHEKRRIELALEGAIADGLVSITWMEGQSWRALQRALRQGPWHIFHFIGHGGFDRNADEGFLALADGHQQTYRCTATSLGRLLNDHPSLRLVVLNACEGAAGSQDDLFSSTAATLVLRGIPAVVAMQYEITDTAAIELARTFYELVAEGAPVDDALSETRKAISLAAANSFEWGTPVLFMRASSGVLFRPTQVPAPPEPAPATTPPAAAGIPADLLRRLRKTLPRSTAFDSDRTLRALFVDDRLAPWREQLPHAASVAARVEATIDFLQEQRRADTGGSALALLLLILQERTDPADALYLEFGNLAAALGERTPGADPPPAAGPPPEPRTSSSPDTGEPAPETRRVPAVTSAEPDAVPLPAAGAPDTHPDAEPVAETPAPPEAAVEPRETGARAPSAPVASLSGTEEKAAAVGPERPLPAGEEQAPPAAPVPKASFSVTPLHVLEGYDSQIQSLAFSPDGSYLATGSGGDMFSGDTAIRLWRMPQGELERKLEGHRGTVRVVAFSPDGRLLASASFDRTVRLWRVADGQPLQTLEGHTREVRDVAFSPDGTILASASRDNTIRLWRLPEGQELGTLEEHAKAVQSVAFSPDGTLLVSASEDQSIGLWHMPQRRHLHRLEGGEQGVEVVAFAPDGTLLASASRDGTVWLWQMPAARHLQTLAGHSNWVRDVAFSPDGQFLISGSSDSTLRIWQLPGGALVDTIDTQDGWLVGVYGVAFSPDGTLLASGGAGKVVRVWQCRT